MIGARRKDHRQDDSQVDQDRIYNSGAQCDTGSSQFSILPIRRARDRSDDQHDQDHDIGGCRSKAQVEGLETVAVDVDAHRLGRAGRSTGGEQVDHVEDAEGIDHAPQQHHQDGLAQQGQGEVDKALPGGGAVDAGRLEWLIGQGLQPRQEQQGDERGGIPHIHQDHRGHRHRRFAQPLHRAHDPRRPGSS